MPVKTGGPAIFSITDDDWFTVVEFTLALRNSEDLPTRAIELTMVRPGSYKDASMWVVILSIPPENFKFTWDEFWWAYPFFSQVSFPINTAGLNYSIAI